MRKALLLIANGMPAVMDLGVGAFIVAVAGYMFPLETGLFQLFAGSLLAVLPDLHAVVLILMGASGEEINAQHVSLPHRPLLMLPIAPTAVAVVFGWQWGVIAFTCLLWHFLHDTPPLGEQTVLNWSWPWGTDPVPDDHHGEWLEKVWLRPTPRSILEIGTGGTALVVALNISQYSTLAVFAASSIVVGTVLIWFLWLSTND